MNGIDQLVEQHIKQYELRLKHIDELLIRATSAVTPTVPAISEQLSAMIEERNKFAGHIDKLRVKSLEHWRKEHIAKSGPMAIWDIIAQQLETFVERVEQKH